MAWAGALFVTALALGGIVLVCCAIVALVSTTLAFVAAKLRELTREPWPTKHDRPKFEQPRGNQGSR